MTPAKPTGDEPPRSGTSSDAPGPRRRNSPTARTWWGRIAFALVLTVLVLLGILVAIITLGLTAMAVDTCGPGSATPTGKPVTEAIAGLSAWVGLAAATVLALVWAVVANRRGTSIWAGLLPGAVVYGTGLILTVAAGSAMGCS